MTIDDFIEIVHPKIKQEVKTEKQPIEGSELMLTGVKEVHGEPIDSNKMYMMDVPVVIHHPHERKMKLAWLRGGKQAVRNYLSRWFEKKKLDKIMEVL